MPPLDQLSISGQLNVAVVQVEFNAAEPLDARISRVETLVSEIQGADLVVLPELWLHGGFSYETWRDEAISLKDDVVARMSEVSRIGNTWLHAGSYMETLADPASEMWNTSVLFDNLGNIRATYKKIHRFGFSDGEPRLIAAGEEPVVVPLQTKTATVSTGLSTCYDLRFPELYRHMATVGATLNLVPACWPLSRVGHWETLGRARAIENQAFVVQCNMTGSDHQIELGGHSQIIDGNGTVLAKAGREETVIQARLDFDQLAETRRSFPVLQDRRADMWTGQGFPASGASFPETARALSALPDVRQGG